MAIFLTALASSIPHIISLTKAVLLYSNKSISCSHGNHIYQPNIYSMALEIIVSLFCGVLPSCGTTCESEKVV
jgi:hypothetical protein